MDTSLPVDLAPAARRPARLNLARLAIAAFLALCGLLCGCSNIASARIAVTANPLSVSLELTGPTAIGSVDYTLPSGAILSYQDPASGTAATVQLVAPAHVAGTAAAATAPDPAGAAGLNATPGP